MKDGAGNLTAIISARNAHAGCRNGSRAALRGRGVTAHPVTAAQRSARMVRGVIRRAAVEVGGTDTRLPGRAG